MVEEWLEIAGFEGLYEVSTLGRIRTIDKMQRYLLRNGVEAFRFIPAHAVSQQLNNVGYPIAHLYRENRRYVRTIHRLVALAFLPLVEGKTEVDHRDHDRTNATLSNLRWCTRSENLKWRRRA